MTRRNRQFLRPIKGYVELLLGAKHKDNDNTAVQRLNDNITPARIGQSTDKKFITSNPGTVPVQGGARGEGQGPQSPPMSMSKEQLRPAHVVSGQNVAGGSADRAEELFQPGGLRNTLDGDRSSLSRAGDPVDTVGRGTSQPNAVMTQIHNAPRMESEVVQESFSLVTESVGQIVRPVRHKRQPERLVDGDPSHPRFNRVKGC